MRNIILCDGLEVEPVAKLCRRYGLGIEIQSFYDPEFLEREPDAIARHKAVVNGIEPRSVHGPFGDLNAGSFDRMIREVTRNRMELGYEVATKLNAGHLVFHLGFVPRTSPFEHWIKRCRDFWNDFLSDKNTGIDIHLENGNELSPDTLGDAIVAIGSDSVDVCLDIGHAHCNSTTPVVEWIEDLGDLIGYVHLHDNHGDGDEHLGLGKGTIPVEEVCDALNEHCPDAIWAIEAQGDGIEQSLRWLDARGYIKLSRRNGRKEPSP
jgi:sugar phosphate isomerase/epimerase